MNLVSVGFGPQPDPARANALTSQAGSPLACLWLMVLDNSSISPKQFLCKSDRLISGPASVVDNGFNYYENFQSANQISYSVAYPWSGTGVGGWWKASLVASTPIASDISPVNGDGGKTLTALQNSGNRKAYNSDNHEGAGQNVAFADGHVDWTTSPYQGNYGLDNIFTMGPPVAGQQQAISSSGTLPAPASGATPYDIIMVPCRRTSTGQLF